MTTRERSNIITASRMRSYLECPQKHDYEYIQGYRPVQAPEALRFGNLWHGIMECGYRNVMAIQRGKPASFEGDLYQTFHLACLGAIPKDIDLYEAAKIRAAIRGVVAVLRQIAFFDTHEILGVEVPFVFPHVNPKTSRTSPLWVRGGKIDCIVKHRATGRVRVMEHKTHSDSIGIADVYWQNLNLDNQISQYVVGTESMFVGITVDEVVYDVLRKTLMRPARATPPEDRKYTQPKYKACPECKKKGGQDSAPHVLITEDGIGKTSTSCSPDPDDISKRRICTDPGGRLYANMREKDETPEEYEARVWTEDIEPDLLATFRVQVVPRMESQVVEHLKSAWLLGQMMRADEVEGWAVKNPNACHRFGTCPYWAVCTNQTTLEDAGKYQRIASLHPELGETFVEDVNSIKQQKP